jgi:hypothetical protein
LKCSVGAFWVSIPALSAVAPRVTCIAELGPVLAVESTVERWHGQKSLPVFNGVDHPRWPKGAYQAGSPIDAAVGAKAWYILYKGGILAVLNEQGQLLNLLDPEDGIPATTQRLLVNHRTAELFAGSAGEGVIATSGPR